MRKVAAQIIDKAGLEHGLPDPCTAILSTPTCPFLYWGIFGKEQRTLLLKPTRVCSPI